MENSQRTVDDLYADMERRISAAPCGNCPVELTSAFLKLCLAQSCGKCVPCRIGLDRLAALLDQLLDGQGSQADLDTILRTAQSIVDSADCATDSRPPKWSWTGMWPSRTITWPT